VALPKQYRLSDRKEFERVYRRGQRSGGQALLLRIAKQPKVLSKRSEARPGIPATPQCFSRIAVVVSTKVHKRAVVRNRIRRQIQAAFQSLLARLKPGNLIVVTVKTTALECDYCNFLQQLEQLLIKAEALHGH